jgi:hypothetical protein
MKIIARTNANDSDMVDLLRVTAWTGYAKVHKDMFRGVIKPEEFNGDGIEMELTRADK